MELEQTDQGRNVDLAARPTPEQQVEALDQQVSLALEAKDFKLIVALAQERNKLMDAMIKEELRATTLVAIKEELAFIRLSPDAMVKVEAVMRHRKLGEFVLRFRLDLEGEAKTANTESPLKAHAGQAIALVDAPTKSRTPRASSSSSGNGGNGGTQAECVDKDGVVVDTHVSTAAAIRHWRPNDKDTDPNVYNKARRESAMAAIERDHGIRIRTA